MVLQVAPKPKLRKGLWSPEEDEKLVRYISKFGHKCWSIVPKQAGLQRCGKSCRLRWINYLRPDLKRGQFSDEEESMIIKLHSMLGNRWAQIATQLPGRTDNEIKNFWNSCLRKKLRQFGIDPNTHKPILDFPVKLGAQSEGEVLDSILNKSDSAIHQTSISTSSSSSRTYSGQCGQHLQHQGCGQSGQSDTENSFSLSMLPITLGPSQRNLQLQPHLLPIPKACYSLDHESLVDDQSCILGQSSPSDFSSHESSTETGCSETISTPFPWDQSCNDGLIRSWSSDSSWGFPEWTEMGLLEC